MTKDHIKPILIAGGSGSRLWPISRSSYPKQFALQSSGKSLYQQTLARVAGSGFSSPVITCAHEMRFLAAQQLQETGIKGAKIYLEPEACNTAPAAAVGALDALKEDPNALILILPCDHVLDDDLSFALQLDKAAKAARDAKIVCFGLPTTFGNPEYGYLSRANPSMGGWLVDEFVEKPNAIRAEEMAQSGQYMWNSGIFLSRADVLLDAMATHMPKSFEAAKQAWLSARADLDFNVLDPKAWAKVEPASIDTAVMEKSDRLHLFALNGAWSDMGGFEAVAQSAIDVHNGKVIDYECENSILLATDPQQCVVGLGLENIVVVATSDAVLVAQKDHLGKMKNVMHKMRCEGVLQADLHPTDRRPWGNFKSLALDSRFQVKKLTVLPGQKLSLQSHLHRQEHWVVVTGTVKAHIDGKDHLISEGQSVYVPIGVKHRLSNPGKLPAVVIEVQTGSYLGEDDIVRYEDIYARIN